jgi:very-short-patch-repair endonuclease
MLRLRAPIWQDLAEQQHGILSRAQLLAIGLSPGQARVDIDNGRWRPLLPGVYASFTGPISTMARTWAAVLYAGSGAATSHRTALWLGGLLEEACDPVHVSIPASRRVLRQPGIRIHLSRALDDESQTIVHPSANPPRIRLEGALLDQCEYESAGETAHLVLSAIQRRLTTADRIQRVLATRTRHRWRRLLIDILSEARDGVASPLELRYRRNVERNHGLPSGVRNRREQFPGRASTYRDVRYPQWTTIVELDGQEAHPRDEKFRDMRRDNRTTMAGDAALRYGWRDVAGDPCAVAAQVAELLTARGWSGSPQPCGGKCGLSRS